MGKGGEVPVDGERGVVRDAVAGLVGGGLGGRGGGVDGCQGDVGYVAFV